MGILEKLATAQEPVDPKTGLTKSQAAQSRQAEELEEIGGADTILEIGPAQDAGLGLTRQSVVKEKLFDDAREGAADLYGSPDIIGGNVNVETDDLEDLAAFGQSTASKWGNGLTKFVGKTLTAGVGGIGALASTIGALGKLATGEEASTAFKSIFDNDFQRGLDDINEALDGKLPNYMSKEEREYGFFRSMGTANFWANDFTNGLSFIAGAVLTETALSMASAATFGAAAPIQAAYTAALVARAARVFRLAGRGKKALEMTAKGAKALSAMNKGLGIGTRLKQASRVARQLASGAGYEAGVEARHHMDSVTKDLISKFKEENGRAPSEQEEAYIRDLATQSANAVFAGNLALVGYTNMLQFPKIFGPGMRSKSKSFGKIIRDMGDDAVAAPYRAAYKSWSQGRNIASTAFHLLKNPFYEGFVEEGGQKWIDLAGQHASAEAYSKKDRPNGVRAALEMVYAMDDTFMEAYGTKESQKEIGLGFLLGALGLPTYARQESTKSGDGKKGKRKFEMQGGVFEALKERKELRKRTDDLVDYLNKNPNAVQALKRNFEQYSEQVNLQEEMDAALASNNVFAYKNAENDAFFSYVHSRIEGGFFNDLMDDMDSIREMTDEEFVRDFGYEQENLSPEEIADRKEKVISSAIQKAKKIQEATKTVDNAYKGENEKVRRGLIHAAAVIENVDTREKEINQKIDAMTGGGMRSNAMKQLDGELRGNTRETFNKQVERLTEILGLDDKAAEDAKMGAEERTLLEAVLEEALVRRDQGIGDNTIEDLELLTKFKLNNPTEFSKAHVVDELLGLLRDSRMLRARRQEFLQMYNQLFTEEGAKKYSQQIEFYMDEYSKEEAERIKQEREQVLREGNKAKFYEHFRNSQFQTNGKTYAFLDPTTLYNIKDGNEKIPLDAIFNERGLLPGVQELNEQDIERRKVREAVQRIQSTNVKKITELTQQVKELDSKLAELSAKLQERLKGNIRREGLQYRDMRTGRYVSVNSMETLFQETEQLYNDLNEQRDKLLEDKKLIEENQSFLDKMLRETESAFMLSMEDRVELERQVKAEGLEALNISGTTLQKDGTQKLSTFGELDANIDASITRSEQALELVMSQIEMLEDDIQKVKDYREVLKDILLEDRALKLVNEFRQKYPGIEPTYEAITKFVNENPEIKQANQYMISFLEGTDGVLLQNLFKELSAIEKAKADENFLLDEFYASEDKLEKLQAVLNNAKAREARLLDTLEQKYAGLDKVQRALLFAKNYGALQGNIGQIEAQELLEYEKAKGAIKEAEQSESEGDDVYMDDPADFGVDLSNMTSGREGRKEEEEEGFYKPDLATVGHGKTAGIDRGDKHTNLSPEHMSLSQRRYYKFLDGLNAKVVQSGTYQLRAITKANNPFAELDNEFVDKDHIILVVSDSKGNPVKVGDDFIFTSMMLPDPTGKRFSGVEGNEAILEEQVKEFTNLRKKIAAAETGKNILLPVTGLSKGMPHMEPKTVDKQTGRSGNPKKSVVGRLTDSENKVGKIPLDIATTPADSNGYSMLPMFGKGYKAIRGMVYAKHKGRPVPMETRQLNDAEIETVYQILMRYGRALGSTDPEVLKNASVIEGTDIPVFQRLNELVKFGLYKDSGHNKNYRIYTTPDGYLVFGNNKILLNSLDPDATVVSTVTDPDTGVVKRETVSAYNAENVQKLKAFLSKKRHNISKKNLNSSEKYTSIQIDSTGNVVPTTYTNYNEYLMKPREGGDPYDIPLTTGLVPLSDNTNLTQFKFTYLEFDISQGKTQAQPKPQVTQSNPEAGTDISEFKQQAGEIAEPDAPQDIDNPYIDSKDMKSGTTYDLAVIDANGKEERRVQVKIAADNTLYLVDPNDENVPIQGILDATQASLANNPEASFNLAFEILKKNNPGITKDLRILNPGTQNTSGSDISIKEQPSSAEQSIIDKPAEKELKVDPNDTSFDAFDAILKANGAIDDPNAQDPDQVQNLLVDVVTEKYERANVQEEKAWFENKFPGIPIKIVDGLIDGKAYGRTLNASRVIISDLSVQGTTYHEGFHVVMGKFTTPEAKQKLFDAYSRLTGVTENVEEGLAEEFRSYMLADGKYKIPGESGKDLSLIQRFFKNLKEILMGMLGMGPRADQARIQKFFANIRNNKFTKPAPDAEAQFSMDKRIKLEDGSRMTVEQSRDLVETLISSTFGYMFRGDSNISIHDLLDLSSRQHSDAIANETSMLINKAFQLHINTLANLGKTFAQAGQTERASDIMNLINTINDNRPAIKEAMFDWLAQFKVEFEGQAQEESTKLRDSYNINEANEVNAKEMAPALVKLLMATLPASRSRATQNSVYGFGLVDYRPFFNLVMRELAGTESLEDQVVKLKNLKINHPEFGDLNNNKGPISVLIDRLKTSSNPESLTPNQFRLQRQFRQQFHKFNSNDKLAMIDPDEKSIRFIDANSDRESALLIEEFRSNLKEIFIKGTGPFKKDPDTEEILIDADKKLNINGRQISMRDFTSAKVRTTADDAIALLEYFGVQFTNKETLSADEKNTIFQEMQEGVLPQAVELANNNESIEDFFSTQSGAYTRMKNIIGIQAKRTDKTIDLQFQNAEGKTVYSIILNNFATNIIGRLNNGKLPRFMIGAGNALKKSLQGSILLDSVGENEIVMGSINGSKDEGRRTGRVFQDMSPRKRFQTEFTATLQGIIPMLRASEKKTEFVFDLTKKNEDGISIFNKMPKDRDAFVEQMKMYLRAEIYKAKVQAGNNIADYRNNKHRLRLFDYLGDAVKLDEITSVDQIDAYIEENAAAIDAGILKYLDSRNEAMLKHSLKNLVFIESEAGVSYNTMLHRDVLASMGIMGDSLQDRKLKHADVMRIIERFNMLSLVGNIEQTMLILGDVGFFKADSYFKRTSGPHGPKKFADNSEAVNQWLNNNYERLDGKVADGMMNTMVFEDVVGRVADETFIDYAVSLGADRSAIAAKLADNTVEVDEATENAYEALKGYLEFEEGDAQGYITLDEYMEFLERVGDVTPNQRAAYRKLQNGETLTAEEIAYFTPLKPQYYGPTYSKELYAPAFYKLSLLPVFPQLANAVGENSNLSKMYQDMINNKVGLAVFGSGVKVGRIVDNENRGNDYYDETGIYSGIEPQNIQQLYYEFMGIQVEMGEKVKTKLVKGSQARSLLASNAYEAGRPVNKRVANIDKQLNELENETIESQFEQLVMDLGLELDPDGEYYTTQDGIEKFAEMLTKEARRRDMSDSYIEGIEEFLASKSQVLDLLGNKPKIENLLYSLVANRILRYKTFGSAKVQVASTGFEVEARATYQDKHTYGSNVEALKFYRQEGGKTMAMEVMLPHYFKEMLGENVEAREDGIYSDGVKVGNKDLLEVFGYRIPTSALNSIEAIVIKGFLPESAGEAIMVPSEIVVKAGSDYDIDKLSIHLPNYTYNSRTGQLETVKYLTEANSTAEERVKQLRRLDPRKYKLLLTKTKNGEAASKAFAKLSEQFKDMRMLLNEHYKTDESQELLKEIDQLYLDKRKATKSQRDILDIEIGLKLSQLVKKIGIDDTGADISIQSELNKIEKLFEQLDKKLVESIKKDDSITILNQNAQKAIDNQSTKLAREVVLDPDNFDQLIRPVSADRTKEQATEIRRAKGMKQDKPSFSRLMEFEYAQEMGTRFWVGKQGLGVAAVTNTHQIKAQRAGLQVITSTSNFGGIKFPHAAPTISEDGKYALYDVGLRKDAEGEHYISEIIGEFINAFVDVAKDPFVFDVNANPITSGVYFGLLRTGVPLRYITRFMTQPAIERMVEEKVDAGITPLKVIAQGLSEDYAQLLPEDLSKAQLKDVAENGFTSESIADMETMLEMSSKMEEYEGLIRSGKKPAEAAKQLNMSLVDIAKFVNAQINFLGDFISYRENIANPLSQLSGAVVADRGGMAPKSRMEARLQNKLMQNLIDEGRFNNLDKYIEGGFQKSFEEALFNSSKMFNNLFMSDRNEQVQTISDRLLERVLFRFDLSMDDKLKYASMLEHNFVTYALSTISTDNTKALHKDASRLFQGSKDVPSLPRRVKQLKDALRKEGRKSPILDELFPILQKYDFNDRKFSIENIKKFSKRLATYDRNVLIEDFQVLLEGDPKLADDIIRFTIMQSGQMTSPISFTDLVPAAHYMRVVEPIIMKYLETDIDHSNFEEQFIRNNYKNPLAVETKKQKYLSYDDYEAMSMGMKVELKRDELIVSGRIARNNGMSSKYPPADYVAIEMPDKSLTSKEKELRKLRGQSTKTKKLFKLEEGEMDRFNALQQFIEKYGPEEGYKKAPKNLKRPVRYKQIAGLGDGMRLSEYGPVNHMSIIRENNILNDNKDYTVFSTDENLQEIMDEHKEVREEVEVKEPAERVVTGDIFKMAGVPIIPTNSDAELVDLSHRAKVMGLNPVGEFKATTKSVSAPIKQGAMTGIDIPMFVVTLGKLDSLAKKNPGTTFLLPPLGLGIVDRMVESQAVTDTMMSAVKNLLEENNNITLVLPDPSGQPALKDLITGLETYFKC